MYLYERPLRTYARKNYATLEINPNAYHAASVFVMSCEKLLVNDKIRASCQTNMSTSIKSNVTNIKYEG